MISFNKIRDLIKKETVEDEAVRKTPRDEDTTPAPVPVTPIQESKPPASSRPRTAFAVKPPGDTQELDDEIIAEQLDGLKRTLEANAFEKKDVPVTKEQSPFGKSPPTIEMERPDFKE